MNFDIFEGEGEAGAEFRRRTGYAIPRQVSELYVTRNPSSAAPFAVKSIEEIDGVLFSWPPRARDRMQFFVDFMRGARGARSWDCRKWYRGDSSDSNVGSG